MSFFKFDIIKNKLMWVYLDYENLSKQSIKHLIKSDWIKLTDVSFCKQIFK